MTYSQKWELRFLEMADMVAAGPKDPSSKVGAVLVRPDRTLASVGFKRLPARAQRRPGAVRRPGLQDRDGPPPRRTRSASRRNQSLEGHTLYVSGLPPCCSCASEIIQAGIARVVARHNMVPARWVRNMSWAIDNMLAKGIVVDTFRRPHRTWHEITRPSDLWLEDEPVLPAASFCACAA